MKTYRQTIFPNPKVNIILIVTENKFIVLKLCILRPNQHLFEFSNNNSRIKCEICSKLDATDLLVSLLLTLNINDAFLVFFGGFCWVFFAVFDLNLSMCFRVRSRSPATYEMKLSVTRISNSFQLFPFFCFFLFLFFLKRFRGTPPMFQCNLEKI